MTHGSSFLHSAALLQRGRLRRVDLQCVPEVPDPDQYEGWDNSTEEAHHD